MPFKHIVLFDGIRIDKTCGNLQHIALCSKNRKQSPDLYKGKCMYWSCELSIWSKCYFGVYFAINERMSIHSKHNTRAATSRVRDENTYIVLFLTRQNGPITDDNTMLPTHRFRVSLGLFTVC